MSKAGRPRALDEAKRREICALVSMGSSLEGAARIDRNDPVTAPGIPPDFPDPKSLITDDCIRPAK